MITEFLMSQRHLILATGQFLSSPWHFRHGRASPKGWGGLIHSLIGRQLRKVAFTPSPRAAIILRNCAGVVQ